MVKNHLKRIATPKTWTILRKVNTFTTRPNSGAHTLEFGMSLNTFIKEIVGLAHTTKEVKKMIHDREVVVDAVQRKDEKFNVGFMDVVAFPKIKKYYRITLNQKGKLVAVDITEDESSTKVANITGKTSIKGGKFQLGLSGGRSIIIDKNQYVVGDALLLHLPDQKVMSHVPLGKGASVIILSGKHAGEHGVIDEMDKESVTISSAHGQVITKTSNIFVTGDKKPLVTCSQ